MYNYIDYIANSMHAHFALHNAYDLWRTLPRNVASWAIEASSYIRVFLPEKPLKTRVKTEFLTLLNFADLRVEGANA